MGHPNGRQVVTQLISAYEREADLYAGLEEAALEQQDLLVNGRDPERLDALLERQRHLAEHIGKIESGIAPLRQYWEQIRDAARGPQAENLMRTLDLLLEDLADRIHNIVEIERQNSRVLLAEAALHRTAR